MVLIMVSFRHSDQRLCFRYAAAVVVVPSSVVLVAVEVSSRVVVTVVSITKLVVLVFLHRQQISFPLYMFTSPRNLR